MAHAPMPEAIAQAVNAIMSTVTYVQKKGTNEFHKYKFAAVGDVLAKLQPALAENGLIITQGETSHELIGDGQLMTATYEFILSHKSGVEWDERPKHTGMAAAKNSKGGYDDKALNKCHTAARKYFLMALFQIPSGDIADPDEDGDAPPANSRSRRSLRLIRPLQRRSMKSATRRWNGRRVQSRRSQPSRGSVIWTPGKRSSPRR